jgi:hypothetical protein
LKILEGAHVCISSFNVACLKLALKLGLHNGTLTFLAGHVIIEAYFVFDQICYKSGAIVFNHLFYWPLGTLCLRSQVGWTLNCVKMTG